MISTIEVTAGGIGMEVASEPCEETTKRITQIVRLHFPVNQVPSEIAQLCEDLSLLGSQYDVALRAMLEFLANHGMDVEL